MAIRTALPFEFPFRWNDLREYFRDLSDKALADMDQRDRDLEDFLAGLGGGGVPTLFVAASNATDRSKGYADHTCDGIDDDEEINEALTALTATGGRVLLSEGRFNTTSALSVTGCILEGLGASTTIDGVLPTSGFTGVVTVGDGGVVRHLVVDANANSFQPGVLVGEAAKVNTATLLGVRVTAARYGVFLWATDALIGDCRMDNCGWGIFSTEADDVRIVSNRVTAPSSSFSVPFTGGGIFVDNGSGYSIVGNSLDGMTVHGILVETPCTHVAVTGNTIRASGSSTLDTGTGLLRVNGSSRVTVSGNAVHAQNEQAVLLSSTEDSVVSGNSLHGHMRVGGGTQGQRNLIVGNQFYDDPTYPPTITVEAGVTDSCFDSNFLPGGLASFTDGGTTTQRGTNFAKGATW